jgi:hypothetical protein
MFCPGYTIQSFATTGFSLLQFDTQLIPHLSLTGGLTVDKCYSLLYFPAEAMDFRTLDHCTNFRFMFQLVSLLTVF